MSYAPWRERARAAWMAERAAEARATLVREQHERNVVLSEKCARYEQALSEIARLNVGPAPEIARRALGR